MIAQEALHMVAIPSMNNMHLEDMILMNQLSKNALAKDFALAKTSFNELIEHSIMHFREEEKMMKQKGFSSYFMHKKEHDKVLSEMQAVAQRFYENEEDFELIKAYIDGALAPWMLHHVETSDTLAAQYISEN